MAYSKTKSKFSIVTLVAGLVLGVIAGSFIPDYLSPLVLIKKITSK